MYTLKKLVTSHIAIASKPAPTRTVYIRENRVAYKAFATRLTPTAFVRVHAKKSPAKKAGLKGAAVMLSVVYPPRGKPCPRSA